MSKNTKEIVNVTENEIFQIVKQRYLERGLNKKHRISEEKIDHFLHSVSHLLFRGSQRGLNPFDGVLQFIQGLEFLFEEHWKLEFLDGEHKVKRHDFLNRRKSARIKIRKARSLLKSANSKIRKASELLYEGLAGIGIGSRFLLLLQEKHFGNLNLLHSNTLNITRGIDSLIETISKAEAIKKYKGIEYVNGISSLNEFFMKYKNELKFIALEPFESAQFRSVKRGNRARGTIPKFISNSAYCIGVSISEQTVSRYLDELVDE